MVFVKIQNTKQKLIACPSKRMPKTTKNYSITELNLCGLVISIVSFTYLLKKEDCDIIIII